MSPPWGPPADFSWIEGRKMSNFPFGGPTPDRLPNGSPHPSRGRGHFSFATPRGPFTEPVRPYRPGVPVGHQAAMGKPRDLASMPERLDATGYSLLPFEDRTKFTQLAPNVFARRDRIDAVKHALAQRKK
jgi:hypothetical protein